MKVWQYGGAAVAVAAAVGVGVSVFGKDPQRNPAATAPAPATTEIKRQDLVDSESVDGTLNYKNGRTVSTGASGTVTWVPARGSRIGRGDPLLKADRLPVILMYGKLPLYRELKMGITDGPDVKQLERNLSSLGYGTGMTVDDEFTRATYWAVRAWQEDNGLMETGRVDSAQVVFLPGKARVTSVKAAVGAKIQPGQDVFEVSGLRQVIKVDLDTDKQALAKEGDKIVATLPGGERATGKITKVGKVAESSGEEEDASTTVEIEITLDKPPKSKLDQAPVTVDMESERVKNVLAVPVEALLAFREGGYGVEVVESGKTRFVPVEVGAFGGGMVEISGAGLSEGMKVGVPKS